MRILLSLAIVMTMALAACGNGTTTGGSGSSGQGGASPTGCADWANWQCMEGNPGCYAECGGNAVICDDTQCGRNDTPICSDYTPSGTGCGDCQALVQGSFCL